MYVCWGVCARPPSPRTTIRTIRHVPPPDRAAPSVFALANDLISPLAIASFPSLPRNLNGGQYIRRGEITWRCCALAALPRLLLLCVSCPTCPTYPPPCPAPLLLPPSSSAPSTPHLLPLTVSLPSFNSPIRLPLLLFLFFFLLRPISSLFLLLFLRPLHILPLLLPDSSSRPCNLPFISHDQVLQES